MFAGGFAILIVAYYVWQWATKAETDRGFFTKALVAFILMAGGVFIGFGAKLATTTLG